VVQGSTLPYVAARLGVRMRTVEPEPWNISIRLRREPAHLRRFELAPQSRAAGRRIRDLPLSERAWIVVVVREGEAVRAGGRTVLQPRDEVLVLSDEADAPVLQRLFEGRRQRPYV
jgi:potassium/hydrogen antiporter